jgi:hypothetical protein
MLHHRAFFVGEGGGMGNVVEYIKRVNDVDFFNAAMV